MKRAVKCPNCNTYFDVNNIYNGETKVYCNCLNCKFPLRIKTFDTTIIETISLLSNKKYFDEVKNHFIGYTLYPIVRDFYNKPPTNYKF